VMYGAAAAPGARQRPMRFDPVQIQVPPA